MPIDDADRKKLKVLAIQAKTPQEHLVVGEAYATRAQLFSNERAAWKHYLIAAEGGNAEAQFRVSEGYLYGSYGVIRDREKARYWMKAAAAQGHKVAKRALPDVDTVPF